MKELESLRFFQAAIQNRGNSSFLMEEIKIFIESYLSRFDEELSTLRLDRRPGRPPTTRQQKLEQQLETDKQLYQTGFRVPDIRDKKTVENLRNWNGSPGGTTILKFIRVTKDLSDATEMED